MPIFWSSSKYGFFISRLHLYKESLSCDVLTLQSLLQAIINSPTIVITRLLWTHTRFQWWKEYFYIICWVILDHLVNSHLSFSPGYRGVHLDTSSVSPDSHSVSTARIQGCIHSYSVHSHYTPGSTPQDTVLSAPKSILWYYISTPLPSSICLLNYALFNWHFSWEYERISICSQRTKRHLLLRVP